MEMVKSYTLNVKRNILPLYNILNSKAKLNAICNVEYMQTIMFKFTHNPQGFFAGTISPICYERNFNEFFLSIWTQLAVNQRR